MPDVAARDPVDEWFFVVAELEGEADKPVAAMRADAARNFNTSIVSL
jgi:hypothetical protein